MKYKEALREETRQRIREIGKADILAGIPCRNDEDTIAYVVRAVGEGLAKYFPELRSVIMVADGGSLDDTREMASSARVPDKVAKIVAIYRGLPGKGTSVREILEAGQELGARACAIVDSDLRSITPKWMDRLIRPVISEGFDYVTPAYLRHKYDGTISNNIGYPLTRALYGKRIRQPMGGDFAISEALVKSYLIEDVWMSDVARFGIDIWMTTQAINKGYPICQVNLGIKVHDPKEPSVALGPMFKEVVGTVFELMKRYENNWTQVKGSKHIKTLSRGPKGHPGRHVVEPEALVVDYEGMINQFQISNHSYKALWREIIHEEDSRMVKELASAQRIEDFEFSPELWARIVYDFAVAYDQLAKEIPKSKILDLMVPFYFARVGSFAKQTRDMTSLEAEREIEAQAKIFEKLKPYLIERWAT